MKKYKKMKIYNPQLLLKLYKNTEISNNYSDFGFHSNNRDIDRKHVEYLSWLMNNNKCEILPSVWQPILVIDNYFEIIDERTKIKPKYIILDGQHRFETFKENIEDVLFCNISILLKDIKNINIEKLANEVADRVDMLNTGSKSYTSKQTRVRRERVNPYLMFIKKESANMDITVHNDRKVDKKKHTHNDNDYKTIPFDFLSYDWVNKAITYTLPNIEKNNRKKKWMENYVLNDEDKKEIIKAIKYCKCFIEGLDGHMPNSTTILYSWLKYVNSNIKGVEIDDEYFDKLTKFLKNKMKLKISDKDELNFYIGILYNDEKGNRSKNIAEFLNDNYEVNVTNKNMNNDKNIKIYDIKSIFEKEMV